jgi:CBS-domain-containing membrane protein
MRIQLNEKQREKLGEYFSNVSQILIAGVVVGQLFSEKSPNWKIVVAGLAAAAVNLLFALWWFRKK